MNQLVSILMPYKDCALFLKETLDSILNQSYSNWELIAINDHSSDKGEEIVNSYAEKDHRITPIKNKGKGIIEALNTGNKKSNGYYITRMDADDIMLNHKLAALKATLDRSVKDSVAVGQVFYFKSNGEKIGNGYLSYQNWINDLAIKGSSFSEIYKECPIPSPSWMMIKSTFEKIGAFDSSCYPEDYELAFRMYKNNLTVVSTSTIVHHWRDYKTRTSRTDENYKDNRFLALKTKSFIEIDHQKEKQLVLLGAGKKGKLIAKLFIENEVNFEWFCGTKNKIGHNIYGKTLKNSATIFNGSQIIIAIANKEELNLIKQEEVLSNDYYYFC
jgi:glycosyltransferase involved in cell wall biosynthesis